MRAIDDLLHHYQHVISDLTVVTGSKGIFEVEVDGTVLYSKKVAGRHAKDGEILELFRGYVGTDVAQYEH